MGASFSALCGAHAALDLLTGASMLWNLDAAAAAAHGKDRAAALLGPSDAAATPAQAATRASERLAGVLLIDVGLLLAVAATAKETAVHRRVAAVALVAHGLTAAYRVAWARGVPEVAPDVPGQLATDAALAATWAAWLGHSLWRGSSV
jgi:hypothetical protein